jgi:hypothetical protein
MMNNLAIVEVEEMSDVETPKPVLAYTRGEDSAKEKAQLVESIVDYLLANGGMPA